MYKHLAFISSLILVVNAQYGVVPVGGDHITGVIGQDYTLECEQRLRSSSSDPAPDLTWSHSGVDIENGTKYSITKEKNESAKYTVSTLTVRNAQFADGGEYRCTGVNGGTTILLKLSVDAEVQIKSNDDNEFLLAEGLVLTCKVGEAVNVTNIDVMWRYKRNTNQEWKDLSEGEQDVNGDSTKEVRVIGDMVTLLTSDPAAAGYYECLVTLEGTTQSEEVVVSGILEVRAPQSIKVSEREKGVIRCEASSVPRPEIIWAYNDTVIEETTDKYEWKKDILPGDDSMVISELHILDVTVNDGENTNYTCTGKIGDKVVSKEIILRIRDPMAALWPFIGIVSEVAVLIVIILIHEACTKGEDIGETDDDEEDHLLQKNRTITRDGEQTRMRGTNN